MADSETIERSGTVAILGRSNVGKSTLLNAALSMPLAIVSNKPQTTRQAFLGVVRHAGAEIILLDTPGLHRAQDRLGKEMNRAARSAAKSADVIVFVTALPEHVLADACLEFINNINLEPDLLLKRLWSKFELDPDFEKLLVSN